MDRWTEQLSEYLDDTLPRSEREALDAHLATCAECRATLDELGRVVDRARGLDDRPPSQDLWSGIATRIGSGKAVVSIDRARMPARAARRLSFSVPQALAAGILLMAVSSGAVWMSLRGHQTISRQGSSIGPVGGENVTWTDSVDAGVDPIVARLRNTLAENRAQLRDTTVRILEKNLAIIDSAIVEARRALDADPSNNYLNHHLADVVRRRADLLRRVSTLGVRT